MGRDQLDFFFKRLHKIIRSFNYSLSLYFPELIKVSFLVQCFVFTNKTAR